MSQQLDRLARELEKHGPVNVLLDARLALSVRTLTLHPADALTRAADAYVRRGPQSFYFE
jgi:hypothetical protein